LKVNNGLRTAPAIIIPLPSNRSRRLMRSGMQTIFAKIYLVQRASELRNRQKLDIRLVLLVIIGVMKGFGGSDARLLRDILAGDTGAWQKFILQYSNFIYRAIIQYTDDYDEKMAVYLHVLEKLRENGFERLRAFAFRAKLSTWLTVVARRLALDFLRSRYGRDFGLKKIRVVSIDGEPGYLKLLGDMATPETELAARERRERRQLLERDLRLAMEKLGDRERLAVQLVYFQGVKIKEVGQLLQIPSAYKFVARTLKKIRAEMDQASRFSCAEIADVFQGEAHE
jgi:RNA polymerase sigma factor (sigma-70 family)